MHFQYPALVLSSHLVVLISYLCAHDLLPLLYVNHYLWAFPFIIFMFLVVVFFFFLCRVPLVFVVKLVWWCWILLVLHVCEAFWFPQIWMSLAGWSILSCRFYPFITLNISCHFPCRVSAEKSADNLMWIPSYVIYCFSLVAFNVFSLTLILLSFINMSLIMFLLGFSLYGTLCFLD